MINPANLQANHFMRIERALAARARWLDDDGALPQKVPAEPIADIATALCGNPSAVLRELAPLLTDEREGVGAEAAALCFDWLLGFVGDMASWHELPKDVTDAVTQAAIAAVAVVDARVSHVPDLLGLIAHANNEAPEPHGRLDLATLATGCINAPSPGAYFAACAAVATALKTCCVPDAAVVALVGQALESGFDHPDPLAKWGAATLLHALVMMLDLLCCNEETAVFDDDAVDGSGGNNGDVGADLGRNAAIAIMAGHIGTAVRGFARYGTNKLLSCLTASAIEPGLFRTTMTKCVTEVLEILIFRFKYLGGAFTDDLAVLGARLREFVVAKVSMTTVPDQAAGAMLLPLLMDLFDDVDGVREMPHLLRLAQVPDNRARAAAALAMRNIVLRDHDAVLANLPLLCGVVGELVSLAAVNDICVANAAAEAVYTLCSAAEDFGLGNKDNSNEPQRPSVIIPLVPTLIGDMLQAALARDGEPGLYHVQVLDILIEHLGIDRNVTSSAARRKIVGTTLLALVTQPRVLAHAGRWVSVVHSCGSLLRACDAGGEAHQLAEVHADADNGAADFRDVVVVAAVQFVLVVARAVPANGLVYSSACRVDALHALGVWLQALPTVVICLPLPVETLCACVEPGQPADVQQAALGVVGDWARGAGGLWSALPADDDREVVSGLFAIISEAFLAMRAAPTPVLAVQCARLAAIGDVLLGHGSCAAIAAADPLVRAFLADAVLCFEACARAAYFAARAMRAQCPVDDDVYNAVDDDHDDVNNTCIAVIEAMCDTFDGVTTGLHVLHETGRLAMAAAVLPSAVAAGRAAFVFCHDPEDGSPLEGGNDLRTKVLGLCGDLLVFCAATPALCAVLLPLLPDITDLVGCIQREVAAANDCDEADFSLPEGPDCKNRDGSSTRELKMVAYALHKLADFNESIK